VVNPDGTGLERLANFGGVEGIADWSLDGTRIVYMGFAADWDIYVMNADGSGVTQLTRNHQVVDWQPNWR
jgi:Tol biopolymer transport system component